MKNWLRATTAFAGAAALTLGGAVAAVAANSVDDGSNVKTFEVTWSNKVKRYDPALEGTKINVLLYCEVYEFKDGKKPVTCLTTSGQCSHSPSAKMRRFRSI